MSRSGRLILATVIGLAFIAAFIGYGLFEQSQYSDEAANQRADYAKYAADEIRQTCFGEVGLEQAKCLHKAVAEYRLKARDNQREQSDLVAQRKSALWTAIMGIAALIGMALSVVGVILVWTTFQETKRSADAAHDANRPWVEATITGLVSLTIQNNSIRARVNVSLANRGNSPATELYARLVSVTVPVDHLDGEKVIRHPLNEFLDRYVEIGEQRKAYLGSLLFPGVEKPAKTFGSNIACEITVPGQPERFRYWVGLGITYKWGNQVCRTLYYFLVTSSSGGQVFTSEDVTYGPDQFRLNDMASEYAT